ncbi:P-loop containing nucleoside triphosphate hydrolase protein [Suillus clintonianus]|uniref:P-loop containing nucleoside triphosphate hydrolase protein n=1 Tax=Suillus clintonianus TaxID=1904413 RepID=UPI001B87DAEF|nr:P-loop containing nucleoside triphosphate hydrolase protein [Suillus clintonianus]KAG2140561.1 P-loop containing nucleoside triphosphate hydrolase protein [Suillus clintonianus]
MSECGRQHHPARVIHLIPIDFSSSCTLCIPVLGRQSPMEVTSPSSEPDLSDFNDSLPLNCHKEPIDVISISSDNNENTPIKGLFASSTSRNNVPMDMDSPSSDNFQAIREQIRSVIQRIMNDVSAREKSAAQMNVVITIITQETDMVIIMKTGGGKSMSWMVPSIINPTTKSIVVCPFIALLDEQYKKTVAAGLHCHNYCESKMVPNNVQILFVQVKHCSSNVFSSFLLSPLGKLFSRLFVDEFHDGQYFHPEHVSQWKALARQFSAMFIVIVLLTATGSPTRVASFIKLFSLKLNQITEVQSSTNCPEIGMHVVQIQPIAARQSLIHLVAALSQRLSEVEHILVLYDHSPLQAYNLNMWDEGESKVMACTTAFAQGIDRPSVQYVVIFKPSFGLIVNNQMLGRAGCDRRESHVFFLTDDRGPSLPMIIEWTTQGRSIKENASRQVFEGPDGEREPTEELVEEEHAEVRQQLAKVKGQMNQCGDWGGDTVLCGIISRCTILDALKSRLEEVLVSSLRNVSDEYQRGGLPAVMDALEVIFSKPVKEKNSKITQILKNTSAGVASLKSVGFQSHINHYGNTFRLLALKDEFPTYKEIVKLTQASETVNTAGWQALTRLSGLYDTILNGKHGDPTVFVPYIAEIDEAIVHTRQKAEGQATVDGQGVGEDVGLVDGDPKGSIALSIDDGDRDGQGP